MPRSAKVSGKKDKKSAAGSSGMGCLLLLLLMAWVGWSDGDDGGKKRTSSKPRTTSTAARDDGRVAFIAGNLLVTRASTPVAFSEAAFKAWMDTGQAKDSLGLANLMGSGLLGTLPTRSKVRVLDRSAWSGWVQLRVEDPGGSLYGSAVYAVADYGNFDWHSTAGAK
jgi:hypothetical protein